MIAGLESLMGSVGEFVHGVDWEGVATRVGDVATEIGKIVEPLAKVANLVVKVGEGLFALPKLREDAQNAAGDWLARKLNPELEREPAGLRESRQRALAEYAADHPPGFHEINLLSKLSNGPGGTHIEGKADVVVHVHSATASPKEIGDAARRGVETGMATALEQQAIHAGTRRGRRR